MATGNLIRRFDVDRVVYAIALSPDGSQIAATHGVDSDHVTLLDVQTGAVIREFPYATGDSTHYMMKVMWGPDDDTLIVGGEGGLYVLDINTGENVRTFGGTRAPVFSFDHSADWRYLIAGDTEGTVVLWDYASGQEIRRYAGHPAAVWELFFSPDGATAYSTSYSGPVIEWQVADWPLDKLLDWVQKNRFVRDFTCDERAQYSIEPLCE